MALSPITVPLGSPPESAPIETRVEPEPDPIEPIPVFLVEEGEGCWMDANPEFRFIGNSRNVQVYITCEYEVMEIFSPARSQ